jgi:hypothetical protein
MAKKTSTNPVSEYLASIGRKGGQAEGRPKGFANMDEAESKRIREKALATRRANAAKKAGAKGPAKKAPKKGA